MLRHLTIRCVHTALFAVLLFSLAVWTLPAATQAMTCSEGDNPPEGYTLVLCSAPGDGDTVESLGWTASSEGWSIVEAGGKHWIEGVSDGATYAYIEVPAMANADHVIVEYTAHYVSAGNTWALQFLADSPDQAMGSSFMLLSAWDGVYFRRYHANEAVAASTIVSPPKVFPDEIVTIRAVYNHADKTIEVYRNGDRMPEYPQLLPNEFLLKGPDQTLIKLFANTGGAAGETTARWTDIRVWVKH